MVADALIAADPVYHFAENRNNPEEYVNYTDNILTQIEFSTKPELAESR